MMTQVTEQLICRMLDGELDKTQADQIKAELKADPAAAELLNEYSRIDALTAEALQASVHGADEAEAGRIAGSIVHPHLRLADESAAAPAWSWPAAALTAAAMALLAAGVMIAWQAMNAPATGTGAPAQTARILPLPVAAPVAPAPAAAPVMAVRALPVPVPDADGDPAALPGGASPIRERRITNRGIFGVSDGDSGNIYLFEINDQKVERKTTSLDL